MHGRLVGGDMKAKIVLSLAAVIVVLLGALGGLYLHGKLELTREQLSSTKDALADATERLQSAEKGIELLNEQTERVQKIATDTEQLRTVLRMQAATLRREIEELKRNDQQVRDWMDGSIPPALGLRYRREATTDPAAYRRGLPTDSVPATGTPDSNQE